MINEKIKKIEESQHLIQKEPPQGGVRLLPHMPNTATQTQPQSVSHETTFTKEVKVEYAQPIIRPAAVLPTPAQQNNRCISPKPSAEGLAMEKLWTPSHVSGYESCTSDYEHKFESDMETKISKETKIEKLPTATVELRAPSLVKQAARSVSMYAPAAHSRASVGDITLIPGSPPEICFAPKTEFRRHSMVEAMEKTLEENVKYGPKKVVPLSVPTLTPVVPSTKPATPRIMCTPPPPTQKPLFKPPPPVLPSRLGRSDYYESDYESDRRIHSGSESDEATFRSKLIDGSTNVNNNNTYSSFKTSGYAADTEEISSFKKMESTMQESRSYFESNSVGKPPEQQPQPLCQPQPLRQPQPLYQPQLQKQPPAQLFYPSETRQHDKQEFASQKEYKREEKDYKCSSSMTSSASYNISSTTNAPKYQAATPIKAAPAAASPVAAQRRTPADFSDYSSEVDERFRSASRTYESDSDIKGYRVVFPPTPTPKQNIANGHKSPVIVVTPSPMEFEPTPAALSTYARPKFEPIKKEIIHEIKTETSELQKQQSYQHEKQQQVFKPKPVAAKFIAATQQQQQQQQEQMRPTMYYNAIAGTPLHTAKLATETKNVMHMKESSETCERIVNMQQTKRVIHFDNQKEEQQSSSTISKFGNSAPLEPFPYRVSAERMTPARQVRVPPPPTPTKFIPGDFRESDYESEVENAKIRPLWTPQGEWGPLRYRHVEPPQPGRACSLPRTYERVMSPMEFDRGPEMPTKIKIDANALRKERASCISPQSRTQSLNRNTSMRNSYNKCYQSTLHEHEQQQNQSFARDDMNLQVGSPPKYGYIQTQADAQAKQMGSAFMQKSHQFINDITSDFKSSSNTSKASTTQLVNGSHAFRPGFKRAPSEGDNKPQAYRNDSRVSQYGTKCVDPDTGLIYFKYDFGYEFGILFPGEGRKFVGNQWNSSKSSLPSSANGIQTISGKKSSYPLNLPTGDDLVIPVQHENSRGGISKRSSFSPHYGAGSNPNLYSTQHAQTNGFHSDTETHDRRKLSVSFADQQHNTNKLKKRYSLPITQNIDINIDRLHANDALTRLPFIRTVPELPTDVPVNAYLNRDEHPQRAPTFITPLKEIAVVPGQTARFECIVQCHPQPNVEWSRSGLEIKNSNKHIIEYRNGVCRLTMPQTFSDDAGAYACTASNPLGSATTTGQLLVSNNNNRAVLYKN